MLLDLTNYKCGDNNETIHMITVIQLVERRLDLVGGCHFDVRYNWIKINKRSLNIVCIDLLC